ncbi:hypothetical protein L2E82_08402 [Cichorium intybus]|uniref:Uncharacterized protein n=1 Tax=Cichorium intybus TaxID=13427 RepID=A0ACB9G7D0_CICIN|nr:hypothetical protein L2E82_08402 [Cichorium intybus]
MLLLSVKDYESYSLLKVQGILSQPLQPGQCVGFSVKGKARKEGMKYVLVTGALAVLVVFFFRSIKLVCTCLNSFHARRTMENLGEDHSFDIVIGYSHVKPPPSFVHQIIQSKVKTLRINPGIQLFRQLRNQPRWYIQKYPLSVNLGHMFATLLDEHEKARGRPINSENVLAWR